MTGPEPTGPAGPCPDDDLLSRDVEGRTTGAQAAEIRAHLVACPSCRRLVAALLKVAVPTGPGPAVEDAGSTPLLRGTVIGRYLVLDLVGAGAMGMIYSAYDPELDRKLALKLLRADTVAEDLPAVLGRLQREAQAMARLKHPNVVAVHDVGVAEGRLFIAMDLVEGQTMRGWLAARPRTWREVLEVFIQAGHGLAAAHRAGLIHRDFKPDNVLIDAEGRVFVTDFGLASFGGEPGGPRAADGGAALSDSPILLTGTGALLGTPAYMAPEQRTGKVDARSDLYAFCVSLWEGLFGRHPFPTESLEQLRAAGAAGRVLEPVGAAGVPGQVRRALLRGLSPKPEDRPASLEALLAALTADPGRRLRWVAAGIVLLGAVAGVSAVVAGRASDRAAVCSGGPARLAGVWSPARRAQLAEAFARTTGPLAADSLPRVGAVLDRYAASWTDGFRQACEATRLRGEQSEALLDRRMTCLGQRLGELDALVGALAVASGPTVERAVNAAYALPPVSACADVAALAAVLPPPAEGLPARNVAEGRPLVARARALHDAGRDREGFPAAQAAVELARTAGYVPLEAEARFALAQLQVGLGDPKAAEASFRTAAAAAIIGGLDGVAARAEIQLVRLLAEARRAADALALAELAHAAVVRSGKAPALEADFLYARGLIYQQDERGAEALVDHKRALALLEQEYGKDDPRVGNALNTIALDHARVQNYVEYLRFAERAYGILERTLGPEHPQTLNVLSTVASSLTELGRYQEARAKAEDALRRRERLLGPDHVAIGSALGIVIQIDVLEGRHEEAARGCARMLAIWEHGFGPERAELIYVLTLRSLPLARLGRTDEALAGLERARRIGAKFYAADHPMTGLIVASEAAVLEEAGREREAEERYGAAVALFTKSAPDTEDLGWALDGVGRGLARAGRPREALEHHRTALVMIEKATVPENPMTYPAWLGIAESSLDLGAREAAQRAAERILGLGVASHLDPEILAAVRFALARALADDPAGDGRAVRLAREARSALLGRSVASRALAARVDRWLAAHAEPARRPVER